MPAVSRAVFTSAIGTRYPDNTAQLITPALLRDGMRDLIDSALLAEDIAGFSINYSQLVGAPDLSTLSDIITAAERSKLGGVEDGATANATDAALRDRGTHTGTQPVTTITGLAPVAVSNSYGDLVGTPDLSALADIITAGERAKLSGVEDGATANAADSDLRDRATHTGTQPAATITGLAAVAVSNSYGDLDGVPAIPAAASDLGAPSASGFSAIEVITQSAFDALATPDPDTIYLKTAG